MSTRTTPTGSLFACLRIVRWVYPPWLFWHWFCRRWIGHDCDDQPVTCRSEFLFRLPSWVWLDV